MIPKVIHYCWFGRNPIPAEYQKYIASWKKFLPDYEIKEWNEDNYDVNCIPFSSEAYGVKKYAYVSDYARLRLSCMKMEVSILIRMWRLSGRWMT